ncbi:AcvB/VirJ family lysyl-phosphatidylglycerol hydrolase [Sphingomonas ginsenosidivorax]|uniref:AcvB/VirJ family lysyl-phosphatidylglycerol hydrolase n=1 Tax=Sphingomonas ginsenosidivorax TaxID=862135 RepID=UPI00131508C6|nr:AcvB/VirJ family lysyl-phosphatidylglycerol hydrolase [Sphingomonas ginsenosidivorax]
MTDSVSSHPRPRIARLAGIILVVALFGRLWSGGYLDRSAIRRFPAETHAGPVDALFFSGDAGMRFGMGPFIAEALAARGASVTAVSTSTLFRYGATRGELNRRVADAVAHAEQAAGSRKLVVIGQSYGADVLQTGLAHLPVRLRERIAGIVLIVPGTGTYFRADPLGLTYELEPDSRSIETVSAIDWTPLTCIYGADETDSVCPLLRMRNAAVVRLPGGHYLNHDKPGVAAAVLRAARLDPVRP